MTFVTPTNDSLTKTCNRVRRQVLAQTVEIETETTAEVERARRQHVPYGSTSNHVARCNLDRFARDVSHCRSGLRSVKTPFLNFG